MIFLSWVFFSKTSSREQRIKVELNREEINWRNYINNTKERKENLKHIEIYTPNVFVVGKAICWTVACVFLFSHCTILSMSLPTEGIKNESKNKNTTLRFNHCQSVENKTNDYNREFFFFIRERERGEEWKSRLLDLSKKWIRKRERERVKDIEVEKEPYNIFTDLNSMRAE